MSFKLGDSRYRDKDALLQKMANEPMVLQYQTRTDLALIMARDEMFTEAGGDRPDKPNVMIVLTDGNQLIRKSLWFCQHNIRRFHGECKITSSGYQLSVIIPLMWFVVYWEISCANFELRCDVYFQWSFVLKCYMQCSSFFHWILPISPAIYWSADLKDSNRKQGIHIALHSGLSRV